MRLRALWWLLALALVLDLHFTTSRSTQASKSKHKSDDTERLLLQYPHNPVKWHDQVNVYFKAGEKDKAADLLQDAYLYFPEQTDLAFNQAYVRYEIGQYSTCVTILEKLCGLKKNTKKSKKVAKTNVSSKAETPREMESKWVDLLVKCYVKVGRVADSVKLTDMKLQAIDKKTDPVVHARVALTVYPWRFGAAVWANTAMHYEELIQAAETSLSLPPQEVESTGLRMTPHNSLIFLPNELGSGVVQRHVDQTHPAAPLNGTFPRLRACPACRYRISLRLGYLLWEVRESDVLYPLIAGMLQEHSRRPDPPEVRVYSLTRRPPPQGLLFRGDAVKFISFSGVSGVNAAEVIRRERTEVLLDLTTYGDLTGAHILQHLPAPVQAGYLGYPGPKLARFINCSLWDRHSLPPELVVPAVWGAERIVYMPRAAMPASHTVLFGRAPPCRCPSGGGGGGTGGDECVDGGAAVRRELNVSQDTTLLCNLLQTWKIDPAIFDVWMAVLTDELAGGWAAPPAVLALWRQSADAGRNLAREARRRGVPAERLRFLDRTDDHAGFHRRLCACDLFLDTPFYNAGSTGPTVLWAGVPVLTLPGNRTAARLAAGYVMGAGGRLGNYVVARTAEEYRRLMYLLGRRGGRGWREARAALEWNRDNAQVADTLMSTGRHAEQLERTALLLRRLAAAAPHAASRFHLIVAAT